MALQWPLAVRAGLDPWFCPVQLHALLASHWLNGTAMGSVHALTLERLRLALDWQDLHSINRYLSFFCPAFVQSAKSGHKPVTALVTLVLSHQLILEL